MRNGVLQGRREASGVFAFKGIPFAQPPVGDLRWKPPQPHENWNGVRQADKFGPRAMQRPIFGDMGFRSDGMSEDCLYLNVWTPVQKGKKQSCRYWFISTAAVLWPVTVPKRATMGRAWPAKVWWR